MNKQEIISSISDLSHNITIIDDTIYVYNIYLVGMKVRDQSVDIFWESHTGKRNENTYYFIDSVEQIIALWQELERKSNKIARKVAKSMVIATRAYS
jgi:hypothetical protein